MKYSFQEELYHAEETTSSYAVLSLHLRRLASNVAGPLHLPERRHQGKPAQGSMSKRVNGEQVRFLELARALPLLSQQSSSEKGLLCTVHC